MEASNEFGTAPIGKLLRSQAIPAAAGILTMSLNGIVDTIVVGRFVNSLGIAAITVVMPIVFLISSIGMSIGIGGASIISRAFGAEEPQKAFVTFGNQITLTLTLAILTVLLGYQFTDEILHAFGGQGKILPYAKSYFYIVLIGIPFLAWAMMSNNNIRAVGFPKVAMFILIVPAVSNIILDLVFIIGLGWGIEGAAWATTLSYIASALYATQFFIFGKSKLTLNTHHLALKWEICREIFAIGSVTLARQGTISVLSIVLNNSLFVYGGELAVSIYGIIGRIMMFANFPVLGITQGVVPILGFNYGAELWDRVREAIFLAIKSATGIAFSIFVFILAFAPFLVSIFTPDEQLIAAGSPAMRIAFLATPLIAINLIGSAYFQAIGKALPALLLALTKQGFFLIPLLLTLPRFFGLNGVWMSFPIADVGAALITYWYLRRQLKSEGNL